MKHEQYPGKPEVSLKRKHIEDMDDDAELLLEEVRIRKELGEAVQEVLEARKKVEEAEQKASTLQNELDELETKKYAPLDE